MRVPATPADRERIKKLAKAGILLVIHVCRGIKNGAEENSSRERPTFIRVDAAFEDFTDALYEALDKEGS